MKTQKPSETLEDRKMKVVPYKPSPFGEMPMTLDLSREIAENEKEEPLPFPVVFPVND